MPNHAPTGCSYPGCPELAVRHGRCAQHQRERPPRPSDLRPSSTARGYGYRWQKLRAAYLKQYPWCVWPGCTRRATDVDHIIPKRDGGGDDWDNLQPLCREHHHAKTLAEGKREE